METHSSRRHSPGDPELSCEAVREHLGAYLDGELDGPRPASTPSSAGVRAHLATCPACETARRDLEQDWSLLAHWPAPGDLDDGPAFLRRVQDRLATHRRHSQWRVRALSLAAAAVVLISVSIPLLSPPAQPDTVYELASLEDEIIEDLAVVAEALEVDELVALVDLLPESSGGEDGDLEASETSGREDEFRALLEEFLVEELRG